MIIRTYFAYYKHGFDQHGRQLHDVAHLDVFQVEDGGMAAAYVFEEPDLHRVD